MKYSVGFCKSPSLDGGLLAETDLRDAYLFYEANDAAIALKFMMAVRQTVDAIEKAPLRFPVVFETVRKARVAIFPFVVSYVTDGETIIIACLHDRRNPKIVLERLRALGPPLD